MPAMKWAFSRSSEVAELTEIRVDVWLYGALAQYGGAANQGGFAHLEMDLPAGSSMGDLLARLGVPAEARGVTFINGQLSALPGVQPDLGHVLQAGDRLGIFDTKSMWPYQYRHGAALTAEMSAALAGPQGLHHSYRQEDHTESVP
jgi:hypothetical protein